MKARKWDFRNLPSGELMISNVVCQNLLIIIYFQFIWRWSGDSVLGGRSSLPQTRKVKNIMFETSGNISAYRLQYLTSGNENCTFEVFYNHVNVGFLFFFQLTQLKNASWHWKTAFVWKTWLDLIPQPSLFDQKSWEDEKKNTFKLFWASQRLSNLLKFTVLLLRCVVCY